MLYEGTVRAVGTVDEIQHSTDPVVRQFIEGRADARRHGAADRHVSDRMAAGRMSRERRRDPRKRRGRAKLETSAGGVVVSRARRGAALSAHPRQLSQLGISQGASRRGREAADAAAVREVRGGDRARRRSSCDGEIDTIDWFFRFRGKLVHKVCHFYLMHTDSAQHHAAARRGHHRLPLGAVRRSRASWCRTRMPATCWRARTRWCRRWPTARRIDRTSARGG